jgi:hypothetical protein
MWTRPFLIVGAAAFVSFGLIAAGAVPLDHPAGRAFYVVWRIAGAPFHVVANLLARYAAGLPGWLDAVLVISLGWLPYIVLDRLTRALWMKQGRRQ